MQSRRRLLRTFSKYISFEKKIFKIEVIELLFSELFNKLFTLGQGSLYFVKQFINKVFAIDTDVSFTILINGSLPYSFLYNFQ